MKSEPLPIPARALARHCPELLGFMPAPGELSPMLGELAERLAPALAKGLAQLAGGDPPKISKGSPRDCTMETISAEAAALASHGLLAIGSGEDEDEARLLVTFDAAPVFRLVDRAFGGSGATPHTLPTSFPLSAELLIARLEATVCEALAEALEGKAPVRPVKRHTKLARLAAWPASQKMMQLVLVVEEEGCEPWMLALAFPHETLAKAVSGHFSAAPGSAARPAAADPASEPYASLPVTLTAVLVDMKVPFSRLSGLEAGDVLPVAVARSVPIRAAGRTIAAGMVGELDDRIAVRVTHAFQERIPS